jgi:hypothetical protein
VVHPTRLCQNCAKTLLIRVVGVSCERRPPLRGGCGSQKLYQRARGLRSGVAQLESEAQHGLAAKARIFSLERSCPTLSMAPVLAIVWMVAGIVLKWIMARPAGETEMI